MRQHGSHCTNACPFRIRVAGAFLQAGQPEAALKTLEDYYLRTLRQRKQTSGALVATKTGHGSLSTALPIRSQFLSLARVDG